MDRLVSRVIQLDPQDVMFDALMGDLYYDRAKYKECVLHVLKNKPIVFSDVVLKKCMNCLEALGQHTASVAMHQITVGDDPSSGGFDKKVFNNVNHLNGLQDEWLPYFWDMCYVELLIHVAHQRGEVEKERMLLSHLQRNEMNMNNSAALRKQFTESLKEEFIEKLYLRLLIL
ncbi:integrator complex subunit INTS8 [Acrasis kona]|uniref:Integrator complex subunit INTS8 n=1 Tax=Acrasis kona TaxID=1008807 RepID=A0AAW2YV71_9EUKA